MKRTLLITLIGIFLLSFVAAQVSIGEFKEGEDVRIYQTCNNCTSCNFTRVGNAANPDILSNLQANEDGTYYYYDILYQNFTELGEYAYCYSCGNFADTKTGCINFKITPSGGLDKTLFFLITGLVYLIALSGFFGKNEIVSIFGGLAMIIFGLWTVANGFVDTRDYLTLALSYITIGLGAFFSLSATFSLMED